MKIALVCFNLSWQAGGVRLIYSEAHALKRMGHDVTLYTPEFDPDVYPDLWKGIDIRLVKQDRPPQWQYKSGNLLMRIFEKMKQRRETVRMAKSVADAIDSDVDLVNAHDFSYKIAPFFKAKHPNVPIVLYLADPPYMYLPKANLLYDLASRVFNWYVDRAERRYFKAIDAGATLVERNKVWMEERGIPTRITWSGIDFNNFFAPARNIGGKKQFTIMSVGAINKYRRFEDAIDALKIIRNQHYDAKLVVVCKNIWGEDAYVEELKAFVEKRKLSPYVKLMFEGASEEELRKLYTTSDIFVVPIHLPPPRNGFGWQLVVFEAIAAGMPTIVCNTNDVSEALKDGETALFVDPMSPAQIASKIKTLIDDPALYARIAKAGQEFVRKEMSWEKFSEGILNAAGRKK